MSLIFEPGYRREVLGPFYSYQEQDTQRTWSVPPVFSYTKDPVTDFSEVDFFYPVVTYDRFGPEYRFQILQLFSFSGGETQEEEKKRRFTLFPLVFYQRAEDPDLNYFALLPFYGTIKYRLLRDEIKVIAWPAYVQSRRRDVVTDNYLYPIGHIRRGNNLRGWQVWPLVGSEQKQPGIQTNILDEVEIVPGHDKFFALWPIFFKTESNLGTDNPQKQLSVLPFFSSFRSPQRDSLTAPWPIGFTKTDDREKNYREWGAPWPLVVFARGEGKTANRIWPFYSHAQTPVLESSFVLWPVYRYNRIHSPPLDRDRTRILFFLYSDVNLKNLETEDSARRIDLWPFFTRSRSLTGDTRLQVFAPLEPILPNNKSIERNYSPLWSVWRSEKSGKTGASRHSLLWNLYQRQTTPESKKLSLLFGLFRYESGEDGRRLRLFYIPFGQRDSRKIPSDDSQDLN